MNIEYLLVFLSLVLTVVFAYLVYGMSREFDLGIFRKFFKILIAAAIVSIAGRGLVLLQLGDRLRGLPVGVDVASGVVFFILLTAAFWQLLRDWRKVSLDRPVKRGGKNAS
ncbi:MAG: hypothetical protein QXQ70_04990 [Candidatus Caldarchaeum sp.]